MLIRYEALFDLLSHKLKSNNLTRPESSSPEKLKARNKGKAGAEINQDD
jgi:hypothetical protein